MPLKCLMILGDYVRSDKSDPHMHTYVGRGALLKADIKIDYFTIAAICNRFSFLHGPIWSPIGESKGEHRRINDKI